jgi:hypothetical protein
MYVLLSISAVFISCLAIYGAFTKSPDLWSSDILRYVGVGINSVGVLGFVLATIAAGKDGLGFQGLAGR